MPNSPTEDTSGRIQRTPFPARSTVGLIVLLVVCLGAAGLGALATTPEIDGWYRTLTKPRWNPPDSVFGPVWTTLYVLMAIAAWLVWKQKGRGDAFGPLLLFGLQLVLNVAWSWIFFGMHSPGWAAVEIVVLGLAILATGGWHGPPVGGWASLPARASTPTVQPVLNYE